MIKAVLMVVTVVFARSLFNGFIRVTDDEFNLAVIDKTWWQIWSEPQLGLYIPITYSVWKILAVFGKFAWVYHAASLIVHLVNISLVYRLAGKLGRCAPIVALVFAIHPLQVESVAWITSLRGLLGAMFLLIAVQYRWSLLWFSLAILAKNSMVIGAPILAVIYWRKKQCYHSVATLFIAGLSTVFLYNIHPPTELTLFAPLDILGHYAQKVFYPVGLSIDYGHDVAINIIWIGAAALAALHGGRWLALALFLLLPYLSFLPFAFQNWSYAGDRYMYLPLVAVALWFAPRFSWWRVAICLIFAVISALDVPRFKDEVALYLKARGSGRSVSYYVLGVAASRAGDLDNALKLFRKSRLASPYPDVYTGRAYLAEKYIIELRSKKGTL